MSNDDQDTRLIDIDQGLNEKIVAFYERTSEFFIRKQMIPLFNQCKVLYYSVQMYQFKGKDNMDELTRQISDFLNSIPQGKPVNVTQQIKVSEKMVVVEQAIEEYYQNTFKILAEIGKWMRPKRQVEDEDTEFSMKSFGTKTDLLPIKKEELSKLPPLELLDLFAPKPIHTAHAKYLILKTQAREKNESDSQ